jgi:glycosyltransferase involved in cell wall biosynthesis
MDEMITTKTTPHAKAEARRTITIITPVYNEHDNVAECVRRVREIFDSELPHCSREHLFADNASTDNTVGILRKISSKDASVKVIVNARNVGPFRSTYHALMNATGDAVVVLLAADLQDPPELIPQFVRHWENGSMVVFGRRARREESLVMRMVRHAYYRTVSGLATIDIQPDVGEFQLIDRRVVEALRQCDDYYPYIRGLIANIGFPSVGIDYTWQARARGFSKNRLYHLIDQGLNGLISFTNLPLRACMGFGLLVALTSFLYATFTFVYHLAYFRSAPPGIATLTVAVFFFSGLQLLLIGMLGEYIGAIHSQVRHRPMVVERERINLPDGKQL